MEHMNWSNTEKKIARRAFDMALSREEASLLTDFKARAITPLQCRAKPRAPAR